MCSDTENERDYCSVFDYTYQENPEFGKLIIKACVSSLVARKSVVIPSEKVLKLMDKMTKSELRKEIGKYIFESGYSMESSSGTFRTFDGGIYDAIMLKNGIILNDIYIKLIKMVDPKRGLSIFEASDELVPWNE